jgi:hypothetical protein
MFRLIAAAILITGIIATSYAQGPRTKRRPRVTKAPAEVTLRAEADPRDRRTMGGGNRERRGERTGVANRVDQTRIEQERPSGKPTETRLLKAGTFDGDLRRLPYVKPKRFERPEREEPKPNPVTLGQPDVDGGPVKKEDTIDETNAPVVPSAPAPATVANFAGLDFNTYGNGHPPDTVGDVGPNHYIQSINSSVGIYDKSGNLQAAFGFNTFMSNGNFGNLCDTNNFGDPVVLYDTFEDRWILTDFAFTLDGAGNVTSNSYQCFAVSKTGDPVSGGWNYYYTVDTDYLGDYPKFGVWTDGIYWTASMFGKSAGGTFANPRVRVMNKAQMYAGAPSVQVVTFDAPADDFTILPSNARLQTGTPPPGTPNFFLATWKFLNAITVYKFHVDWDRTSLSTFTGPDTPLSATSWPNASVANAPSFGGNALDTLGIRAMMQNQYTNIGGVESLWATHTVRRANTTGFAAPRWYQVDVTGGTVAPNLIQAATWDPDGANVLYRFIPSLAVNRAGDMAIGYSTSSSTTKPAIKYAGRLASDAVNTFSQGEQVLIQGAGTQTGNCGGTCSRWGDYSSMSLDPDGCTFWFTSMYYAADGLNHQTRIGSFAFPSCTATSNNGGLQGTVTSSATGMPLSGVTVSMGSRTATTNSSGVYTFSNLPQGRYPDMTAASSGYTTSTVNGVDVSDGTIATQNFSLAPANDSGCITETSQTDFQTGTTTNTNLSSSPGDVVLSSPPNTAAQNTSLSTSGVGITTTTWGGQTFTPTVTGRLTRTDINLFCSGCTGTTPNLTLSVRATSGGLPVGADLATATITGFNNGGSAYYTVTFAAPITVTAGTSYALVIRPTANPSPGTYALTRSGADVYAGGTRVAGGTSGTVWSIPLTGTSSTDAGFITYIDAGYTSSGNFVSGAIDSNPTLPGTSTWGAISWNATTPAGTSVKIQVAGSNNVDGPFSFVGPDGTSSTYFSNGNSLGQFNGQRYVKYKAYLSTSDSTVTPSLNDVNICFTNPRVWTGAVSNDWNNPSNWSSSGVPGSGDQAIIPSTGVLNDPTNTSNASVNSLVLGAGRIVDTGANTLTVTNCSPSAVSAGGASSYVKGNLTRCVNNTGTFAFPVGTAAGYAPVSLSNIVGSGNFAVRPSDGVLTGVDSTKSIGRYWDLAPNAGVTQADVTLMYGDGDVPAGADESAFKVIHKNGQRTSAFDPSFKDTSSNTFRLDGVQVFSSWTLGSLLAPTAAPVNVSGRVTTAGGQAIRGAVVTITDDSGRSKTTLTSSFGYYQFGDVAVGRTYVVSANAKRYTFSPRTVSLVDSLTDVNFVAEQ